MASQLTWTLQDVTEYLLDVMEVEESDREARRAKVAIDRAYRRLAAETNWVYYQGTFRLTTDPFYTTGSIAYDHTGGTFAREVTLTGGTWPTWADLGVLRIASIPYQVATRESDTVITLDVNSNPGSDVASGTSYELVRHTYPLPLNARHIQHFADQNRTTYLTHVDPSALTQINTWYTTGTGYPINYAFTGSPDYIGARSIQIAPAPNSEYIYDITYQKWPRQLNHWAYRRGTVAYTAASATITGTNTNWDSSMVGSIIRFSDGTNDPTGRHGSNPFTDERAVIKVSSTTSLTVDAVMSGTATKASYAISDPIDIDPNAMLDALLAGAQERYLSAIRGASKQERESEFTNYVQALQVAMQSDQTARPSDPYGGGLTDRYQIAYTN